MAFTFLHHAVTGLRSLEISDVHVVGCPMDCLSGSSCLRAITVSLGMQVLHLANLQRVSSCVTFRNHTRLLFRMPWTIIFCRYGRKRQFVPDLLSLDTSFVLKKAMIMKAICLPVNIGRFFFSCNSSSALRGLRRSKKFIPLLVLHGIPSICAGFPPAGKR